MDTVKSLWALLWTVGLAVGFGGLGLLGLGLIVGAMLYSVSIFWTVLTILMGLLAVLVAFGAGMTALDRPGEFSS